MAAAMGVERHLVAAVDPRVFGGSALTGAVPVPKGRSLEEIGGSGAGIPVTYVPARNTVFLAHALAWAEVLGAADVFIGVNALDYSGYPDCRPEFLAAFQRVADLATKAGVEEGRRLTVHAPLLHLTKAEIIRRGLELGVDYALTLSCYDPSIDGSLRRLRRLPAAPQGLRGVRGARPGAVPGRGLTDQPAARYGAGLGTSAAGLREHDVERRGAGGRSTAATSRSSPRTSAARAEGSRARGRAVGEVSAAPRALGAAPRVLGVTPMELPRFGGHLMIWEKGVHDGEEQSSVPVGVPTSDGRARAFGSDT